MGGDNMNEKLEDISTELCDEIEKAQKDSQDLIKKWHERRSDDILCDGASEGR